MKKMTLLLAAAFAVMSCGKQTTTDILIIGGGASGTTAALQAARMGASVTLIEESGWLGGMLTAAGVSAIDGNFRLRGGLFGEFVDSLALRYGGIDKLATGWVSNILFEPSVGNAVLKNIAAAEENLEVMFHTALSGVVRQEGEWLATVVVNGKPRTIRARVLIDATELGDVAAACGVPYDVGMDSRADSGEEIAPEQANDIIQDLTFVAIVKDWGENADMTVDMPAGYDREAYACTCKTPDCDEESAGRTVWDCHWMLRYGRLPNGKYMINWPIKGNDYYVNLIELTPAERERELQKAKDFTLGYIYYMQQELGYKNLGLAYDEYGTHDGLPLIPYHRESRRIHGLVRFNVNHAARPFDQPQPLYRTGIAVGDYAVDHHHGRYQGETQLPDLHFYPIPSYNLPLGTLIPQDIEGLVVAEKSVSVSNIVNGTTRLQPVVMQIGQAAGALAALAAQQQKEVAEVSVREVQAAILDADGYIMPYLDLPKGHPHFRALQRIGATGILKGEGKNVGWANETWFGYDVPLRSAELIGGMGEAFPAVNLDLPDGNLSVTAAVDVIAAVAPAARVDAAVWEQLGLTNYDPSRTITRGEFSVLLDAFADPFTTLPVDHDGRFTESI